MRDASMAAPVGCVEIAGGNEACTRGVLIAGLEILVMSEPAESPAGGDVYCLHSCGHHSVVKLVMLDVSGHGRQAAHVAEDLHQLLHGHAQDTGPVSLLQAASRQSASMMGAGVLATALCAVYDARRKLFQYAYGGQPPIGLWRAGHPWTSLGLVPGSRCGLPFGVTTDACYEQQEIELRPGDIVLFMSDGVSETRNGAGDLLQSEGVLRLAQESTDGLTRGLPLLELAWRFMERLKRYGRTPQPEDDVTLIWLRCLPEVSRECKELKCYESPN